jgi:hypothetical protein
MLTGAVVEMDHDFEAAQCRIVSDKISRLPTSSQLDSLLQQIA